MADDAPPAFDPDAPSEELKNAPAFDPNADSSTADAPPFNPKKESKPFDNSWLSPITGAPREAYNETAGALHETNKYLNPFSSEFKEARERAVKGEGGWTDPGTLLGTGKGVLAAASVPVSPAIGAAKSLIGKPYSWLLPQATPEEQDRLRKAGVSENLLPGTSPEENYEKAKGDVGTALQAMGPKARTPSSLFRPPPIPPDTGFTLSKGESTGYLPDIQREQAALRSADALGEPAHQRAVEFREQRGPQLEAEQDKIAPDRPALQQQSSLIDQAGTAIRDGWAPGRQVLAETPMEASNIVGSSVAQAAEDAQAATKAAYQELRDLPGQFHPAAFNKVVESITENLNKGTDPIKVDPQRTPQASAALGDLDEIVGDLRQTRDPETGRIQKREEPLTARAVDDARQRLNTFLGDALSAARSSNNWADVRAVRGVIGAFDAFVASRLKKGTYIGADPADVAAAFDKARGAHASFRKTFTPQGAGDQVGQAIQKIIGRYEGQAAASEEITKMLYGQGPLPVKIAERMNKIFGAGSHEVGAIRQGLYSYITDAGVGKKPFSPTQVADRIDMFTKGPGSSLVQKYLTPQQVSQLQTYGLAMRQQAKQAYLRDVIEAGGPARVANALEKLINNPPNEYRFAPQELQALGAYAKLLRKIEVPGPGAQWSNNAAPIMEGARRMVVRAVADLILHQIGVPLGLSELVAWSANKPFQMIRNRANLNKIREQMPLIAEQQAAYAKAVARYQQANTPANVKILSATSGNLARSLQGLGVNPSQLQGMLAAPAQQQNDQPYKGENLDPLRAVGGAVGYADGGMPYRGANLGPLAPEGDPNGDPDLPPAPVYDPIGTQITPNIGEPTAAPEPQGAFSKAANRLMGTQFGEPRYQLWPEKMIRSGATLAGDMAAGELSYTPGLRREDVTDIPPPAEPTEDSTWLGKKLGIAPVAAEPNDPVIERAQDMAGMAGGASLTGAAEDAVGAGRNVRVLGRQLLSDTSEPGAALSALEKQGFYSPVEKAIERAPQQKMQPSQWLGWLKNQPGVKAEELEHLGLTNPEGMPVSDRGMVTKEDLLKHAKENQVQLEEVVKGADSIRPSELHNAIEQAHEYLADSFAEDHGRNPNSREADELWREAEERVRADPAQYGVESGTKYSDYTLPGGDNYKETLLNLLPEKKGMSDADFNRIKNQTTAIRNDYYQKARELGITPNVTIQILDGGEHAIGRLQGYIEHAGLDPEATHRALDPYLYKAVEAESAYQDAISQRRDGSNRQYQSPHWDEPGNMMHIRTNEREFPVASTPAEAEAQARFAADRDAAKAKLEDLRKQQGEVAREINRIRHEKDDALRADLHAGRITRDEFNEKYNEYSPSKEMAPLQDKLVNLRAEETAIRRNLPEAPPPRKTEKALHLEELQSDLHQAGRKQGYREPVSREEQRAAREHEDAARNEIEHALFDASLNRGISPTSRQMTTYRDMILESEGDVGLLPSWADTPEVAAAAKKYNEAFNANHALERKSRGVPNAPFKQSWPDLGIKHTLLRAVREGHDAVSWTPGKQQAERYSLSNQIDSLHYNPDTKYLIGEKNGQQVYYEKVPEDKLEATVGKEVAQKLLEQEPNKSVPQKPIEQVTSLPDNLEVKKAPYGDEYVVSQRDDSGRHLVWGQTPELAATEAVRWLNTPTGQEYRGVRVEQPKYAGFHSLHNADLDIGGEGMKGFYDKMLKDKFNAIGKKHGAKVEYRDMEFPKKDGDWISGERVMDDLGIPEEQQRDYWRRLTSQERDQHFADWRARNGTKETVKVPYFKITPSLREHIKQNGLPLFEDSAVGAPLSALENAPMFHSAVERAVQASTQAKAPIEQWLSYLKNKPGVKPEELEWLGLDRADELKGNVTKKQLEDYIAAHKTEVKDVTKGGGKTKFDSLTPVQKEQLKRDYEDDFGKDSLESMDDLREYYNQYQRNDQNAAPTTKYAGYQLPGGENYREHLLTMPKKEQPRPPVDSSGWTARRNSDDKDWSIHDANGNLVNELRIDAPNKSEAIRKAVEMAEKRNASDSSGYGRPKDQYRSSHWDEPNVLAHVRTNEREVAGKPSLHLEELQSDWHQQGRKQGYQQKDPELEKLANDPNRDLSVAQTEAIRKGREGVPDAPFKTTWPELALKRMIRMAAEEGKDRISWTPGEAQAERYNLSKHVDRVQAEDLGGGFFRINALSKNTHRPIFNKEVSSKELPEVLGKDLAEKITKDFEPKRKVRVEEQPGGSIKFYDENGNHLGSSAPTTKERIESIQRRLEGSGEHTRSYSGLDLKVGGEGMKGFYDNMLPKMVEKLGKKYGVKVKQTPLGDTPTLHEASEASGGGWHVRDAAGEDIGFYQSKAAAEAAIKSNSPPQVHYFDIPPAMKEQALKHGFPLFADSSKPGAALSAAEKSGSSSRYLRPAVKIGDKIYKGEVGYDHAEALPRALRDKLDAEQKDFEDIGAVPGFVDHKGRFVSDPAKAMEYARENGLLKEEYKSLPNLKTLTTDMLRSDSSKPGAALNANRPDKEKVPRVPAEKDDSDEERKPRRALGGRIEPSNINHNPSEAQKAAGNYAKEHVHIHGLSIAIENAKGSERSGVGPDGKRWKCTLPAHYGYVKGSVGADKDHVDVYLGPHLRSTHVFVVDQKDLKTGKFDEHKAILGYFSKAPALEAYRKAFSDGKGRDRTGAVHWITMEQFKHWLDNGDTTKPFSLPRTLH